MRLKSSNGNRGIRGDDLELEHQALLEAQAELETSRARYADLYDSAPVGYATLNRAGVIEEINLAGARLLNCKREELIRRPLRLYIALTDRKKLLDHVSQVRRGRASVELKLKRRDGEPPVFVELITTPPAIHEGLATRYQSALIEITERKLAQEASRESEERFRLLIEGAPNAMLMADDRGRITIVNAQVEKLFGYTREELAGQSVELLVPARHRHNHPALRTDYHQHPAPRPMGLGRELFGLRKDGTEVPIEIGLNPLRMGDQMFVVASIIDITERKLAEQALRESEERFRTMANAAPVLIWMSGTDKLCDYFNKHWLDFTGHTLEQELGNGWAAGIHPDDLPRCLETYVQSFDRHEPFEMEYRLRRADGMYRWITDHGVPRFTPAGIFLGYIGGCIDITDRREAEEVLRRTRDELEERVRQRTAELANANEELRSQIRERQQLETLVLSISEREQQRIGQDLHDGLCQQLTGIKFRNQLLQQKLAEHNVDEVQDARTIAVLLNQALEQARTLARGLNPVRLETNGLTIALHELAASVAELFDIKCDCRFQKSLAIEDRDAAIHLYRIAQEAVTNAIKHGKAKTVRLQMAEQNGHICLAIQDDGIGFPVTPKKTGSGLHIMNYRARTIGAALEVRPAEHGGTLVTCSLPRPQLKPATKE